MLMLDHGATLSAFNASDLSAMEIIVGSIEHLIFKTCIRSNHLLYSLSLVFRSSN